MTARATVTKADMARTLKAVKDAGLTVREIIMSDGEARFVLAEASKVPHAGQPKEWPAG